MARSSPPRHPGALRARHRKQPARRSAREELILERGTHPFEVNGERIGLLHVSRTPPVEGEVWTLVVLFHGAGADAADILPLLADVPLRHPTLVLAPDSVSTTWDLLHGRMGEDLRRVDAALDRILANVVVAPERTAVSGFSDGASYALSVGLANGNLFPNVIAFSPGFISPPRIAGRPRIFITHGTGDRVLSIDRCSRAVVPRLRTAGYAVDYHEFPGGHSVPEPMVETALEWLAAAPVSAD